MNKFDEDEYERYYDNDHTQRRHNDKKKKFKGHHTKRGVSEGEFWGGIINNENVECEEASESTLLNQNSHVETQTYTPRTNISSTYTNTPKNAVSEARQFVPGPNTHTIKSNIIDFDRVLDIKKIESEHNGNTTYGIKFLFTGRNGTFRIVWFNQDLRSRDACYAAEYSFWKSLHS